MRTIDNGRKPCLHGVIKFLSADPSLLLGKKIYFGLWYQPEVLKPSNIEVTRFALCGVVTKVVANQLIIEGYGTTTNGLSSLGGIWVESE